jgi:hypothetical protein
VRVTKTVVRPGTRNGGTIIVFRLSRPTVLRVTVVRVYPTCERIGTFTVRGRAGVNRIRFRGRLGRRTLPAGSYRLIVRARGAERDAAAVPIVVARGPVSAATVRRLRRAMACSPSESIAGANASEADAGSSGGVLATVKDRIAGGVDSAAGAVSRTARGAKARIAEAAENPSSTLLTVVGLIALLSAILGGLVLARLVRLYRYRQYYG